MVVPLIVIVVAEVISVPLVREGVLPLVVYLTVLPLAGVIVTSALAGSFITGQNVNSSVRVGSSTVTEEAEEYVSAHFPQWDLSSEVVYRFMMAVRRKLSR